MFLPIPVLVTEEKQAGGSDPIVRVTPLFFLQPVEQASNLQRALNKLNKSLREKFESIGKEARQDSIAALSFSPFLNSKMLYFRIFLTSQSFDCKYLFVTFEAFGKLMAYTPNVPDIWFELERGEDLQKRADEVVTEHFRNLERKYGKGTQNPSSFNYSSQSFVTTFDLNIQLKQKFEKKDFNPFAILGSTEEMDGEDELRNVGRCLDSLYPNDLARSIDREHEVYELTKLLNSSDQRPIVIIGKTQVGKTALINEYVFRQVQNRKSNQLSKNLTWLISPQRLISGMSFVGQWEDRLIAILKESKKKNHLLYFDDLIGLFLAGVSASADLNVAQVLKSYIERGEVRVITEATPEVWRVLQEKDRSFAELFQIYRLDETSEAETLKITLSARRITEAKYLCRFSLDTLPTALDLQRRYNREASFPGKIVNFIETLGNKFQNLQITKKNVLEEFQNKSGLQVTFLDDEEKLERNEIIKKIAEGVIGQKAAIEASADVISIAKARLNDPNRPLASFLFLGSTGVGKTEAAKQIANYLYGSEEKLLRFDMNEFVSPYDVARLVGTFDQPEGLLTSAIRRQPFSVVLLDEIEKADADVFNLLLQVMGDGRLTDAHGRTADFSNAIIILTSNLGSREANLKLGFRETNESDAGVYRQAAEKFFRPEFFNRLDKIIPFERLSREDVEQIARIQLQKVFAREGFSRRNCRIELEPSALQKIIDEGYHPELGARALKRAIEKNLVAPVGIQLSKVTSNSPTIVKVSYSNNQFVTQVETVKPIALAESVWLNHDFINADAELDKIVETLDRIEDTLNHLKPKGEINPNDEAQKRYFLVQEYVKRIERMIERADNWRENRNKNKPTKTTSRLLANLKNSNVDFENFLGHSNLSYQLRTLAEENPLFGEEVIDYIQDIWRESSLLQTLANNLEKNFLAKNVMVLRSSDIYFGKNTIPKMFDLYKKLFSQELGLKCEELILNDITTDHFEMFLTLEGLFSFDLAKTESGNHVFVNTRGDFIPLEIRIFELAENQSFKDFPEIYLESIENMKERDFSIVRIYNEREQALDFRTNLISKENLSTKELRTFILGGLEPPIELKNEK